MRCTFAQIKASRIPEALKLCPTDARVLKYCNEATQSLLIRREANGTTQRLAICVSDGNITWPRFVAAVEALAVNQYPVTLRNDWFEFLPRGIGLQPPDAATNGTSNVLCGTSYCNGLIGIDRDPSCLIADISGANKEVKIYIDNAGDVGKQVLIKAKDANGNKYYAADGSYEGFYVTLANPFVLDTHVVSEIYGVIKPVTLGAIRGYQWDTVATTQTPIFIYEPDETTPSYRRTLIESLADTTACPDCSTNASGKKTVTAEVKLEFIPVARDTDFLIIGSVRSIKLACMAILKEEANLFQEAMAYWGAAEMELDKELGFYQGYGEQQEINITTPAGGVGNLI